MAGGKVVANRYPHSNVGTATHFHNAVTKFVVPGDHSTSITFKLIINFDNLQLNLVILTYSYLLLPK